MHVHEYILINKIFMRLINVTQQLYLVIIKFIFINICVVCVFRQIMFNQYICCIVRINKKKKIKRMTYVYVYRFIHKYNKKAKNYKNNKNNV